MNLDSEKYPQVRIVERRGGYGASNPSGSGLRRSDQRHPRETYPSASPLGFRTCSIGMALAVRIRSGNHRYEGCPSCDPEDYIARMYAATAADIVATLLGTDREDAE